MQLKSKNECVRVSLPHRHQQERPRLLRAGSVLGCVGAGLSLLLHCTDLGSQSGECDGGDCREQGVPPASSLITTKRRAINVRCVPVATAASATATAVLTAIKAAGPQAARSHNSNNNNKLCPHDVTAMSPSARG